MIEWRDRRGVGSSRAGLGIGTVVVLGLIGWALGIDPRLLIRGAEMISRDEPTQQQGAPIWGACSIYGAARAVLYFCTWAKTKGGMVANRPSRSTHAAEIAQGTA